MEPLLLSTRACVMLALLEGPGFGAELASRIARRSGGAIVIGDGSLYPTLSKLKKEKLVREQPRGSATITRTFELTTKGDEEALRTAATLRALIKDLRVEVPRAPAAPPAPPVDLAARSPHPVAPPRGTGGGVSSRRAAPARPKDPAPPAVMSNPPAPPPVNEASPERWIESEEEGE